MTVTDYKLLQSVSKQRLDLRKMANNYDNHINNVVAQCLTGMLDHRGKDKRYVTKTYRNCLNDVKAALRPYNITVSYRKSSYEEEVHIYARNTIIPL